MGGPKVVSRHQRYRAFNPEARLLSAARQRAKTQGLPFDLRKEDILIPLLCPALGIPLRREHGGMRTDDSPSLDRLVPAAGYVRGNVRVISWRANRLKNDATLEEMWRLYAYTSDALAEPPIRLLPRKERSK